MAKHIPDRWENYTPIGEKIEGTRFIAFKVPLRDHIVNRLDKEIRLEVTKLLKLVPNLGLIIDLTNTHRYYDPEFFKKEGVQYKKIMVPGHEIPHEILVDEFNATVKDFMEINTDNDKLIGVHCTHGVNRTGFFICNYMILQMTIEPNEAMDIFAKARGHKIERNNYVNYLLNNQKTSIIDEQKAKPENWRERNEDQPNNSNYDQAERKDRSIDDSYSKLYESGYGSRDNYRNRYESRVQNIVKPENWRERKEDPPRNSYIDESRDNRHSKYDNYNKRTRSRSPPHSYQAFGYDSNGHIPFPKPTNDHMANRSYLPMPPPGPDDGPKLILNVNNPFRRPPIALGDEPMLNPPVAYHRRPPIALGDEPMLNPPVAFQPPRLRLDYYNNRSRDRRQRKTYIQNPYL